jgi:peptidoglycan/LPS O-acetylase OafA/YrhL
MISYSIYMVHLPVLTVMQNVGRLLADRTEWPIFRTGTERFGQTLLSGDVYSVVFIGIVIAVSALTYRWVEVPGRDAMKHWVASWATKRVSGRPSQRGIV